MYQCPTCGELCPIYCVSSDGMGTTMIVFWCSHCGTILNKASNGSREDKISKPDLASKHIEEANV